MNFPNPPRPRDYQRSRLYSAERAADTVVAGTRFDSLESARRYTMEIVRSSWWQARWPEVRIVNVLPGKGNRASGDRLAMPQRNGEFFGIVWLRGWSLVASVLMHELAHVVTPRRYSAHGPEFAGNLLLFIRREFGPGKATGLMREFALHGVRYVILSDE